MGGCKCLNIILMHLQESVRWVRWDDWWAATLFPHSGCLGPPTKASHLHAPLIGLAIVQPLGYGYILAATSSASEGFSHVIVGYVS